MLILIFATLLYFLILARLPYAKDFSPLPVLLYVMAPALVLHFSRKDHSLLAVLPVSPTLLKASEYVLMSLPSLFLLVMYGTYSLAAVVICACVLLAFIPKRSTISWRQYARLAFIPAYCWEWRSGWRAQRLSLSMFWILAMVLSFFPIASFVLLWLVHAIIVSFFQQMESEALLRRAIEYQPAYLMRKLKLSVFYQGLLFLPPLILYSVFHPGTVWISLALLVLSAFSLSFVIIVKYRYYHPSSKGGAASLYQSLSILSVFIPFLLPVPIMMGLFFYPRALANIRMYGPSN